MEESSWLNDVSTYGVLIGTVVTALATGVLGWFTRSLVKETQRMVEASARPHVVATIDPNRWSMMHADLRVDNTGSATAYDIQVSFDPPLENGEARRADAAIPFQRLSVLKPGQGLVSYLSEFAPLQGNTYTVTISWRRNPMKAERETNTYTLSMSDVEGVSRLGAFDPLTQIAEEVKHIREDWRWIAAGSRKIKTDIYTSSDRLHERRLHERSRRQRQRERAHRLAQQARQAEVPDDEPTNR